MNCFDCLNPRQMSHLICFLDEIIVMEFWNLFCLTFVIPVKFLFSVMHGGHSKHGFCKKGRWTYWQRKILNKWTTKTSKFVHVTFMLQNLTLSLCIACWEQLLLKERYRIGKKQKSWRSQFYIKLTRSNDDDSWKHPLKYFCMKCHIWWEINNLTLRLEFIAQWAFYSFLFWHRCNAIIVIGSSVFYRDQDGQSISNFYRFVSLCIWWIT